MSKKDFNKKKRLEIAHDSKTKAPQAQTPEPVPAPAEEQAEVRAQEPEHHHEDAHQPALELQHHEQSAEPRQAEQFPAEVQHSQDAQQAYARQEPRYESGAAAEGSQEIRAELERIVQMQQYLEHRIIQIETQAASSPSAQQAAVPEGSAAAGELLQLKDELNQLRESMQASAHYYENLNQQMQLITGHMQQLAQSQDGVVQMSSALGEMEQIRNSITALGQTVENMKSGHEQSASLQKQIGDIFEMITEMEKKLNNVAAEMKEMPAQGAPAPDQRAGDVLAGLEALKAKGEQYSKEQHALKYAIDETYRKFQEVKNEIAQSRSFDEQQIEKLHNAAGLIHFVEERVGGRSSSPYLHSGIRDQFQSERKTELNFKLDDLLEVMIQHNATVLHVRKDSAPLVRVDGELIPVGDSILSAEDCAHLIMPVLDSEQQRLIFNREEITFSRPYGSASFIFNVFVQRGSVGIIIKMHSAALPTLHHLSIPEALKRQIAHRKGGLLIVSGAPGSGKTTVAAAIVDHLNTNEKLHIITIENFIEYVHLDKMSLVTQRELGRDFISTPHAILQSLKKDPNVIFIGEMNSPEVIMSALAAADAGCLVISTMTSSNTIQTIDRIIDSFPPEAKKKLYTLLSKTLAYVICARLLDSEASEGKAIALEILINNHEAAKYIAQGNLQPLNSIMEHDAREGMRTFQQAVTQLLENGTITEEEAQKTLSELKHSSQPELAGVSA